MAASQKFGSQPLAHEAGAAGYEYIVSHIRGLENGGTVKPLEPPVKSSPRLRRKWLLWLELNYFSPVLMPIAKLTCGTQLLPNWKKLFTQCTSNCGRMNMCGVTYSRTPAPP